MSFPDKSSSNSNGFQTRSRYAFATEGDSNEAAATIPATTTSAAATAAAIAQSEKKMQAAEANGHAAASNGMPTRTQTQINGQVAVANPTPVRLEVVAQILSNKSQSQAQKANNQFWHLLQQLIQGIDSRSLQGDLPTILQNLTQQYPPQQLLEGLSHDQIRSNKDHSCHLFVAKLVEQLENKILSKTSTGKICLVTNLLHVLSQIEDPQHKSIYYRTVVLGIKTWLDAKADVKAAGAEKESSPHSLQFLHSLAQFLEQHPNESEFLVSMIHGGYLLRWILQGGVGDTEGYPSKSAKTQEPHKSLKIDVSHLSLNSYSSPVALIAKFVQAWNDLEKKFAGDPKTLELLQNLFKGLEIKKFEKPFLTVEGKKEAFRTLINAFGKRPLASVMEHQFKGVTPQLFLEALEQAGEIGQEILLEQQFSVELHRCSQASDKPWKEFLSFVREFSLAPETKIDALNRHLKQEKREIISRLEANPKLCQLLKRALDLGMKRALASPSLAMNHQIRLLMASVLETPLCSKELKKEYQERLTDAYERMVGNSQELALWTQELESKVSQVSPYARGIAEDIFYGLKIIFSHPQPLPEDQTKRIRGIIDTLLNLSVEDKVPNLKNFYEKILAPFLNKKSHLTPREIVCLETLSARFLSEDATTDLGKKLMIDVAKCQVNPQSLQASVAHLLVEETANAIKNETDQRRVLFNKLLKVLNLLKFRNTIPGLVDQIGLLERSHLTGLTPQEIEKFLKIMFLAHRQFAESFLLANPQFCTPPILLFVVFRLQKEEQWENIPQWLALFDKTSPVSLEVIQLVLSVLRKYQEDPKKFAEKVGLLLPLLPQFFENGKRAIQSLKKAEDKIKKAEDKILFGDGVNQLILQYANTPYVDEKGTPAALCLFQAMRTASLNPSQTMKAVNVLLEKFVAVDRPVQPSLKIGEELFDLVQQLESKGDPSFLAVVFKMVQKFSSEENRALFKTTHSLAMLGWEILIEHSKKPLDKELLTEGLKFLDVLSKELSGKVSPTYIKPLKLMIQNFVQPESFKQLSSDQQSSFLIAVLGFNYPSLTELVKDLAKSSKDPVVMRKLLQELVMSDELKVDDIKKIARDFVQSAILKGLEKPEDRAICYRQAFTIIGRFCDRESDFEKKEVGVVLSRALYSQGVNDFSHDVGSLNQIQIELLSKSASTFKKACEYQTKYPVKDRNACFEKIFDSFLALSDFDGRFSEREKEVIDLIEKSVNLNLLSSESLTKALKKALPNHFETVRAILHVLFDITARPFSDPLHEKDQQFLVPIMKQMMVLSSREALRMSALFLWSHMRFSGAYSKELMSFFVKVFETGFQYLVSQSVAVNKQDDMKTVRSLSDNQKMLIYQHPYNLPVLLAANLLKMTLEFGLHPEGKRWLMDYACYTLQITDHFLEDFKKDKNISKDVSAILEELIVILVPSMNKGETSAWTMGLLFIVKFGELIDVKKTWEKVIEGLSLWNIDSRKDESSWLLDTLKCSWNSMHINVIDLCYLIGRLPDSLAKVVSSELLNHCIFAPKRVLGKEETQALASLLFRLFPMKSESFDEGLEELTPYMKYCPDEVRSIIEKVFSYLMKRKDWPTCTEQFLRKVDEHCFYHKRIPKEVKAEGYNDHLEFLEGAVVVVDSSEKNGDESLTRLNESLLMIEKLSKLEMPYIMRRFKETQDFYLLIRTPFMISLLKEILKFSYPQEIAENVQKMISQLRDIYRNLL